MSKKLFRNITIIALALLVPMITSSCTLPPGILTAPAINVFDSNPMSISSGGVSTLTWSVIGATSIDIQPGVGKVALTGSRQVSPSSTTVYTLTASNQIGSSTATTQVMVTGNAAPPPVTPPAQAIPVINQFTASPDTIYPGASSVLSWNVSNASSVVINTVGTVPSSGRIAVFPNATTIYRITAYNNYGSANSTVQVTVYSSANYNLPTINEFRAVPTVLYAGSPTTLTWNVSNSTDVYIIGVGNVAPVGSTVVSPMFTTSYWLIARNSYGVVNSYALVVVTQGQ
jgi:hypothetical protein